MLFDNSLNDKRFRIDIRVENGYEEGCTRGANLFEWPISSTFSATQKAVSTSVKLLTWSFVCAGIMKAKSSGPRAEDRGYSSTARALLHAQQH